MPDTLCKTVLETTPPDTTLAQILALVQAQRAQEMLMYTQPDDDSNYVGTTVTAAGASVTTVTYTLLDKNAYFFQYLYVDQPAGTTMVWTFQNTTELSPVVTLQGNEHDFGDKVIQSNGNRGGNTLKLAITNTNLAAVNLDIVIRSWMRTLVV